MGVNYKLIVLELKKKLTAAQAEKDTLLKNNSTKQESKAKIKQLDEVIDSLKTQIDLLPK
jgi:predicted nuclease with TOPRIM domain